MKIHLISGIVIIFLVIGLSGCNDLDIIQNNDLGLKIIDYTVVTKWDVFNYEDLQTTTFYESGFYRDYPENTLIYYIVNVTVENNVGELIQVATLNVRFCDKDNNELFNQYSYISALPNTYTKTISISVYKSPNEYEPTNEYFDLVENVKFELSEGFIP